MTNIKRRADNLSASSPTVIYIYSALSNKQFVQYGDRSRVENGKNRVGNSEETLSLFLDIQPKLDML